ncbi:MULTISPECIES: AraC family transcriptional regulator [Pseudomonas]|uniref:AraC family transcriptional regulator n=1 Tax=Pseudomonas fluorescens LMG 5329 TaxID=1324332 RepID=A0A0A1Z620_PSEFL|nr:MULTISPECIES: AraC family transcriptional regulator [Pseudomonas]KGE69730.1 AraC family transcriptional regulator [Pseudomonas fluorescens LMG 5329]NWE03485.1 AraC family transcriptional regulator [Pseudomonas sp. IPO3749]NWF24141.1 AraC family transcriptional regulator [Pseudomonas sp. IPO3749]
MMDPLENLIIHPEMQLEGLAKGDLLSQVLAQIRLTGDRVYACTLAQAQPLELDEKSAHICVLQQGQLRLEIAGQPPKTLNQGDVILLPHSPAGLAMTAVEGAATVVICRFWFDASSFQAMLFALPRLIHIQHADAAAWSEGILHFMLLEAHDTQPGGALMISRLIDLVVIRILRTWVHQGLAFGWLGGLSDARIARALKVIHETPGKQWRIDALAEMAGMSRSNFCDRFSTLVGRSPLRYQNEWRLALAKTMLSKQDARIGEVGFAIGYESEAAFSRAYKAYFGRSPREDNA